MALAVVGGAALSGFFQQVFVKLDFQEVKNFIRGKKLTDGLLKKLRIKLTSVSVVYDDAEQKQLRNPHVKLWMHELKKAVLDAEDHIEGMDLMDYQLLHPPRSEPFFREDVFHSLRQD